LEAAVIASIEVCITGAFAGAAYWAGHQVGNYLDHRINDERHLSNIYNSSAENSSKEKEKKKPRTKPIDLEEQLTLEEAKAGAGERILEGKIDDPRYQEDKWKKQQHIHKHPDGTQTNLHYWENIQTGERNGFKFKDEGRTRFYD